jgi:flagellar FliL protein
MAEEAEQLEQAEEAAPEAPAKKGRGKLVLLLGLVLVAGGGAAAWYLDLVPLGATAPADAEAARPVEVPRVGALHAFEPFIANLEDEDGKRYLKATLQLEFFDASPPEEFEARIPQLRDLLLTLFTSKTYSEIRTPEGKGALRDDIINRVNRTLGHDVVKAVYFTEFIVQ